MKVVVAGALGRMGSVVVQEIIKAPDMELVAGLERPDRTRQNPGFPLISELPETKAVLVDFTEPDASVRLIQCAAHKKMPVVSGTTGFSQEQINTIKALSKQVPLLLSPNMSLGVNLLVELVKMLSGKLDYDVEISELHHSGKKDSPSGTAKALFAAVQQARPSAKMITHRSGPREPDEVGVFGLRGGGVFGDHAVFFLGEHEMISLSHRAFSRKAFAQGTLMAIRFVHAAEPGMYSMADVLGLT